VGHPAARQPFVMTRDEDRIDRVRQALATNHLDALVCSLGANVRLISGYWPVLANALAIATREGGIAIVAPQDESEFAGRGWADVIHTFEPASLQTLGMTVNAVRGALAAARSSLGIGAGAVIGYDGGGWVDPHGYAATFTYGTAITTLLQQAFDGAQLRDASEALSRLRSVLTPYELERVRKACAIARQAYERTAAAIQIGMREIDIAALLRNGLATGEADRSDGFAYCMSGPNSSRAFAAFQRSTDRRVERGEFILLHCNSYCDGLWTDITRTFSVGALRGDRQAVADGAMAARDAAISAVRPGAVASEVDRAARDVMADRGFGVAFKHATGHGVGFSAINHNAAPRIHPLSDERLEPGMVFNVEPAAYLPELGGFRHCDMVVVTTHGAECLTPFDSHVDDLRR
jgi:Xaa-Pro aminopeptidase